MNLHYDQKTKKRKIKYPLVTSDCLPVCPSCLSCLSPVYSILRIIRPEYKVNLADSDTDDCCRK